ETRASMQIFSRFFSPAPYGRIAITQQPQFSFGQSWPTLVYLPVSAFLDSTQRWMLLGEDTFRFSEFIQEITPHEVAHQWWGHMVGWSSYHDQWLSEGFADFSASLFIQSVNKNPKPYLEFLKHWREAILDKNRFGFRANDVGPIWMGRRLRTARTPSAYSKVVYAKGGFVVHMLRRLMYDTKTGDERFIKMMHDFVRSHLHKNATTQSFQQTVERHMTAAMNLDGNDKMDWFFDQWVYGTEVPSYQLDYTLQSQSDGSVVMNGTVTQKGVADDFKMQVPIYVTFGKHIGLLGRAKLTGSTTSQPFQVTFPRKPDAIEINTYYDVLADEIVVNGG
ncbi:MAG: M1 family aminopeptidase, partial [Proteobacteria bacterium]|nr:M1 family aminopeptidase [Pseudomonadota bacterium]